jgi:hypothetical protein
MTRLLWLLSLCLLWQQQFVIPKSPPTDEIHDVEFCELLADPQAYDQKLVRTRALFRYGGEDTIDLYCPDCTGQSWGWVNPIFDDSSCTKRSVAEKLSLEKHSGGTVRITFIGKFFVRKKGEKSYQIYVQCVEKADYITKEYRLPEALPAKTRKRVRC